jgi:cellulose synthase/poly-beta-1,6-N-acetylglucosamine synthase-like glycosyltransferase
MPVQSVTEWSSNLATAAEVHTLSQTVYSAFIVVYLLVLIVLAIYGFHRYLLVYMYYRYKDNAPKPRGQFSEHPKVCIQLPMYNEQYVARRLIEHTCRMDYPRDKLHIQVLDDSTDETIAIAREAVRRFRAQGINIDYIHRDDRTGFKAGALENGLKYTDAEFIAIFDADFIPPPDMLHRTIDHFCDPHVGMIQVRWGHLNRDHSLLTKSQAIFLDGHFMIEHTARNRSGRFMSFNGTAGIWRRECIADAGGWQHDTLTEDLDLSYRAQLKGWKFIFLPDVVSPAELPPEITSFKQQQHRWTKGGAQTARKLLGTIFRSPQSWKVKAEAFFHLTSCTVYIYIVALCLMLLPAIYLRVQIFPNNVFSKILLDITLFTLMTCSAGTFYICSQKEIFHCWTDKMKYLPFLMALGIGISVSNTLAALEGFFARGGEFVRTPKFGVEQKSDTSWRSKLKTFGKLHRRYLPFIEMFFGFYMVACIGLCLYHMTAPLTVPFLVMFAAGFFYVSFTSLASQSHQAGE